MKKLEVNQIEEAADEFSTNKGSIRITRKNEGRIKGLYEGFIAGVKFVNDYYLGNEKDRQDNI